MVDLEPGLEVIPEHARPHSNQQGFVVDLANVAEGRHVADEAAVNGNGATAHAAATSADRRRHRRLVGQGQDRRQLVDIARTHDGSGSGRGFAGGGPGHGQRPPVATGLGAFHQVGGDGRARGFECAEQLVGHGHLPGVDVNRGRGGATGDGDGWCRVTRTELLGGHGCPPDVIGKPAAIRSRSIEER